MLSLLPSLAMAAEHGGHQGHDMAAMQQDMKGIGQFGKSGDVSRTIEVTMGDNMRFSPDQIQVNAGETVHFFVKNAGKADHEMIIGDVASFQKHAEMMRQMPGMKHAKPNMISLKPGQKSGLVWKFAQAGTVGFACLLPGHMEADERLDTGNVKEGHGLLLMPFIIFPDPFIHE